MVVVRLLGTIHIFQYNRMKGGLDFIQFESKTCGHVYIFFKHFPVSLVYNIYIAHKQRKFHQRKKCRSEESET